MDYPLGKDINRFALHCVGILLGGVSDCEELVGVTWKVSDCEELVGGYSYKDNKTNQEVLLTSSL